jgi:hypothetical protein
VPAWATVVLTLGAAAIGAVAAIEGVVLQSRYASAERREATVAARRVRAAEILGRVVTFLTDIEPARIGFNVNQATTPEQMKALAVRLNTLRDERALRG